MGSLSNLQFALIEGLAKIRAFPLYARLVFAPLLKSWFRWEKVSEVVPRVLLLLVWYYIHWREMLDYNKESLNLSRTQCGPFINLQICSLLWLKVLSVLIESLIRFDQKFWSSSTESFHQFWLKVWSNFYQSRSSPTESFDQVWLKVFDQVWLEVLIKFDWKFSSILVESFDQAFINSGWKFWSSFYQFWSSPIESFDQVWMKVLRQSVFINFGWEFDQTFINPDQVRLKVLIKSDWIRASPLHTWLVFIPLLEPLAF